MALVNAGGIDRAFVMGLQTREHFLAGNRIRDSISEEPPRDAGPIGRGPSSGIPFPTACQISLRPSTDANGPRAAPAATATSRIAFPVWYTHGEGGREGERGGESEGERWRESGRERDGGRGSGRERVGGIKGRGWVIFFVFFCFSIVSYSHQPGRGGRARGSTSVGGEDDERAARRSAIMKARIADGGANETAARIGSSSHVVPADPSVAVLAGGGRQPSWAYPLHMSPGATCSGPRAEGDRPDEIRSGAPPGSRCFFMWWGRGEGGGGELESYLNAIKTPPAIWRRAHWHRHG